MNVTVIISKSNIGAISQAEQLATGKNKSYLYGIGDLSHRDLHKSSEVYIISEVDTPFAVQMALTIAGWNPSYQKDLIICSLDHSIETNQKLRTLSPTFITL